VPRDLPTALLICLYAERYRPSCDVRLLYCGNDAKARSVASQLIREIGFDPIDAGPLRIARYVEPFALLVAQLAYEGKGGPELAYRFERLAQK
jgi:predicted dinucleotide-binding enzyme